MGTITTHNFMCADCGKCVLDHPNDYYAVTHALWYKFGVDDGVLCMSCLETKMGRKLEKKDFLDVPINKPILKRLFPEQTDELVPK